MEHTSDDNRAQDHACTASATANLRHLRSKNQHSRNSKAATQTVHFHKNQHSRNPFTSHQLSVLYKHATQPCPASCLSNLLSHLRAPCLSNMHKRNSKSSVGCTRSHCLLRHAGAAAPNKGEEALRATLPAASKDPTSMHDDQPRDACQQQKYGA